MSRTNKGAKIGSSQKGFSLIEVMIALALASIFIAALSQAIGGYVDNNSRQRNDTVVREVANMLAQYYQSRAFTIDTGSPNGGFSVSSEGINIPNSSFSDQENTLSSLRNIARALSFSRASFLDGYNQPMKIMISSMLEEDRGGIKIPYRVVAVASNVDGEFSGGSPDIESSIDTSSGEVDVVGNEMVSIVNLYPSQVERFEDSVRKIETVATAYAQYYWSLHNSSVGYPEIDYFAQGGDEWGGVGILKSCDFSPGSVAGRRTPGVDAGVIGMSETLKVGGSNYRDGWSNPIFVANCGTVDNVMTSDGISTIRPRSPDTPGVNGQPYSAIVGFTMANGQSYIKTVLARF